ncbi:helix-turn-helix domain-containing protein [Conexibacter sp. CPCC 206217]|uniref:helix-turn-helix domain-containing protein n=1 Tax=Conexibacter sp. CPCC 206217 TaxID=3064574 RepID=UPI002728C550|nr:cupin domain-containing protein [Conexibacter sp. CPCC 206217]MDO8211894.1 cupin domain-containing protein [Conexibacter sp. CPCC 206217]
MSQGIQRAAENGHAAAMAPGFGSRLRAERERQGIGVRELSRRLDVSASMISQIERERVMPSVNTLYSITSALGISLDDLFGRERPSAERDGAAAPRGPGFVQRRDTQQSLSLSSGVRWDLLTSEPNADVEFLRASYAVGSESTPADALMRHSGHEYGTVVDGVLCVTVGFETHELQSGDSISFESSTPHRLFNAGDEPAVAIWVVVGRGADPRSTRPH